MVLGQRMIQGFSDIFLGWATDGERDFYVRQLRDRKGGSRQYDASLVSSASMNGVCSINLAEVKTRIGNPRGFQATQNKRF